MWDNLSTIDNSKIYKDSGNNYSVSQSIRKSSHDGDYGPVQHGEQKWTKSRTTRDNTATGFLGSDTVPNEILELNTPQELFSAFLSQ